MDIQDMYINVVNAVFDELDFCSSNMPLSYQIEAIKSAIEVLNESEIFTTTPPDNSIIIQNKILLVSHFLNCSIAHKGKLKKAPLVIAFEHLENALSVLLCNV